MNQDNAFIIGTTHHICQDYAIGGQFLFQDKKNLYTVICDGCSSSQYSDFGARLLSIGVKNELEKLFVSGVEWDFDPMSCVNFAQPVLKQIGLPEESLDATVMAASVSEFGGFALNYGDGVIAIADNYGNIYVVSVEYTDSYPFYLNYTLNAERLDNWEDKHDKRKVTISAIRKDGSFQVLNEDMKALSCFDNDNIHIRNESKRTFVFFNNTEKAIKYIAIMSDGIRSFYSLEDTESSRTNVPLNYHDVLKDLLSFKNFNGEFVQRRLNRFTKDCQKKNWFHSDDLSLGVIHIVGQ